MGSLRSILALATLALFAACAPEGSSSDSEGGEAAASGDAAAGAETAATSDSARLLVDRLMEWQGGREAWDRTRYVSFRWLVSQGDETLADRSHAWDRWEGDYRLTYERDDGSRFYALFDVQTLASDTLEPEGDVWIDDEQLTGAARDSALEQAYGAFVNDSYWLLMPLKWEDPGVHLTYEGMTELPDGESYPAVHLTFESGLGVTDDEYWGFIDPETGRMMAWQYHLQNQEERGSVIWWEDWQQVGPVRMAMDRRNESGDTRIHFEDVVADTVVPEGVFTPPSP